MTPAETGRRGPWEVDDLVHWAIAACGGAVVSAVGWILLSTKATLSRQVPGLDLVVLGLIIFGYAQAAWLLRGARLVDGRTRRLLEAEPAGTDHPDDTAPAQAADYVAVDGLSYFHREACRFTRGRVLVRRPRARHVDEGRRPCPSCKP